jgi:AraC-like DNA-binding protein
MSTPNIREALRAIARYADLFTKSLDARFEETPGEGGVLSWQFLPTVHSPRVQYASFVMAGVVHRLRSISEPAWYPTSVELEHRDLGCTETMRRVFGPNIIFNANRNAIHVDSRTLDRRLASADPRLLVLMRELGDRIHREQPPATDIVTNTRNAIVARLEMGQATLENIAEALDLTPRALQSKLSQADATFDGILNDTRRTLAQHYLRDTDLILTEIAFLLGFSELSVFTRAAQRWFGMAPSAYRQQMREPQVKGGRV